MSNMNNLRKMVLGLLCGLCLFVTAGCQSSETASGGSAIKAFLKDSNKPAVLKFYADWCVTCKAYAPTFDRVKKEFEGSVDFYSVNIDLPSYKDLLREYKISHIPVTLFVSQDRETVVKQAAPIGYEALKEKVQALL